MIIFLNGSINAGKTTIAKILAKKIPNTALVEIDSLREMIEWMPIDQAVPINLENAVSIIKNFSNKKLNVIIPYPLSQENYEYILKELKDVNDKIFFFTLAPKLEKVLENRGTRELNKLELERIKHHYSIGINSPSFGEIIDNTNQTPEETANYILTKTS
jgi:adenylate kinase family enzyme